jgi:hypothetical protein
MSERYANNCATLVSASGYTAGSGVLNVVSTGVPWPQTGTFHVGLFDQTSKLLKVLLVVTAVNSSTQWAVTAEGPDANANAGDLVLGTMITAGVMSALVSAGYPNLIDLPPSTPDPMDDEFNSSSLDPKWTVWNQQSGQTIIVANGFLTMYTPPSIQGRVFAVTQPAPSGTWKVRTKMFFDCATWNYFAINLMARRTAVNKSSHVGFIYHSSYGAPSAWAIHLSGTSQDDGEVDLYNLYNGYFYLELENDGTNLTWRVSLTGAAFSRLYQESLASYLGGAPDQVGLNLHPYGDGNANWGGTASFDWFRRVA